jgi:enterochelin esterase-like enzyme
MRTRFIDGSCLLTRAQQALNVGALRTTVAMHAVERLRVPAAAAGTAALLLFLVGGLLGARSYGLNYWLYRGFDAPKDPAYVTEQGTQQEISVTSPALGGRAQQVYVYLPPGYATSGKRYPVVYLLHGFPGRPLAFLETVRMGVVVDSVAARTHTRGAILVMPFGSTGTFTDKEWANGVGHGQGWATFVSHDLVRAIDSRYRTIPTARGRAIAGLSEGGYGAINIALHNPKEFSVVESWSGYEQPDKLRSIFGSNLRLLGANDPMTLLPREASALRRAHVYVWFYSGSDDPLHKQNSAFAAELARYRIPYHYFEAFGGHNWALWRDNALPAYQVALRRLAHG